MKKLMLGLMMAIAATAAMAEVIADVQIGDLKYTLDTDAKTAKITGSTGSPTEVDVSEVEYEEQKYTVTSVGNGAFIASRTLTSVSLPNVTTVEDSAFWTSSYLVSVSLPNAMMIGNNVFTACLQLTEVSLPSVTTIGGYAFDSCRMLASVALPNATTIGVGAFSRCPLTEVSIPKATSIGENAFSHCSSLTSVSLPSAITIGGDAFTGCSALTDVIVKDKSMKSELSGNRSYYCIGAAVRIYYELTKEQAEATEYVVKSICLQLDGDEIYEDVYQKACEKYGVKRKVAPEKPQLLPEGCVAVTKESIQAAKAETISVANGEIQLGVSVCSNANFTAETANWGKVKFTKDTKVALSEDGTQLIISIPVSSQSGFMILQSGDAKVRN